MNGLKLIGIMGGDTFAGALNPTINPHANLPRYAAMCGFFNVPLMNSADRRIYDIAEIEIPDEIVPKILAFHFSEKATGDLRAMGEAMGKINVSIPSNINVWQHLKGEAPMREAARSLQQAAKLLAEKISA